MARPRQREGRQAPRAFLLKREQPAIEWTLEKPANMAGMSQNAFAATKRMRRDISQRRRLHAGVATCKRGASGWPGRRYVPGSRSTWAGERQSPRSREPRSSSKRLASQTQDCPYRCANRVCVRRCAHAPEGSRYSRASARARCKRLFTFARVKPVRSAISSMVSSSKSRSSRTTR